MGSVSLEVRGLRKLRAQFICLEGHIAETVELNDTLFFFFFFKVCRYRKTWANIEYPINTLYICFDLLNK